MKQQSNHSYREFAYRWRKEVARIQHPMSEKEIVDVFVHVQELEYYDGIMLFVGEKFAEIVKVGETIEDGLNTRKIVRVAASPESSGLLKKKREDVSSISYKRKKIPRKSSSYQGYIHQVGPKPVDTSSKFYRPDQRCAYQSNCVGHDTADCIDLKHKIEDLIDQNVVSLQTVTPNVNSNPLPNHGGVTINMKESDDDLYVTNAIVLFAPNEPERAVALLNIRAVALLSIREKKEFLILTRENMKNKSVDQALSRTIPHLYQLFPVRGCVNDDSLKEGIWGLFGEIDAVIEEEAGTSGICDAEPEEQLQNWTSAPLLISRSSR
uniref:Gag-pro n=1 Tax=Solanum tuberosum TaxID=4113 RepID=M1DZ61_SOLTU